MIVVAMLNYRIDNLEANRLKSLGPKGLINRYEQITVNQYVSITNQSTNEPVSSRLHLNEVSSSLNQYESNHAAAVGAVAANANGAAANAAPVI